MLRIAYSRSRSSFGSGATELASATSSRTSWKRPIESAAAATFRKTLKAVELRWPVPSGAMVRPAATA
jgi:hypothetical protein